MALVDVLGYLQDIPTHGAQQDPHRVAQGLYPLPLWPGGGAFAHHIAASSFAWQRQCRRAALKEAAPTPAFMPNSIPSVFSSADLSTAAPSLAIQWDIFIVQSFEQAVLPAQGAEAAILKSDQFLEAAMIYRKFYNCSHSLSFQIYKSGPDSSPFTQMLDNTKPDLRALNSKCELH